MIQSMAGMLHTFLFQNQSLHQVLNVCELGNEFQWRFLLQPCFHQALHSAVAALFLVIALIIVLLKALSKLRTNSSTSSSSSAKLGFNYYEKQQGNLHLWALSIAGILALVHAGYQLRLLASLGLVFSVETAFACLQSLKFLAFFIILAHERKFGALQHPWLLRIWWMVDFILSSFLLASSIKDLTSGSTSDSVRDIVALVTFPGSVFFLALSITGKTGIILRNKELSEPLLGDSPREITGYATANIFSRAIFNWLTPLLNKGYKSQLHLSDVPELADGDRVESNHARFQSSWPDPPGAHPLRVTLLRCFGRTLVSNGVLALVRLSVMYAGPVLIQKFEDFASSNRSGYEGLGLVLVLLLAKLVEVLSSHQYNFQSQKLGMATRSTIIAAVYQKGLRLSSSSKMSHGVGHIVNYMVVDAQQMSELALQIHNLWLLPAQVCVALVILYGVLGPPMISGLLVMALVMAYNFYVTRKQRNYQGIVMMMRDKRMRAISEALGFMKIIKLQSWEEHFMSRIGECRSQELVFLKKFIHLFNQSMVALWMIGSLVAAAAFGTCFLFGVELTSAKVFTAISTFRILQEPVRNFPQTLISIAQSLVAAGRVEEFLLSGERDPDAVNRLTWKEESEGVAIRVEDGNFSWDQPDPSLRNIDLRVLRGQLIAIVGTVGSGKSSVLTALLGEMRKISGKVEVCGSTAYVPQTAWIQNATIEGNVLFGEAMDRARYNSTIRACALVDDLKLMEFGDQTEIGERGINLSGGQKQRVQLARAIYQNSDIYLLDDVFSAVDAHTGTHLFQECILGVLKGKTILLVTHQVEFLHHADMILVMRDGAIVQTGKYSDLIASGTDLEALVSAHHAAMESLNLELSHDDPISDQPKLERKASSISASKSFKKQPGSSKLIDEEQRETGRVGWRIYWLYFTKAFGWPTLPSILVLQLLCTVASLLSDYWLSYETSQPSFTPGKFLGVYVILNLISWVFAGSRVVLQTTSGLKTAQQLFTEMLQSIFLSPMHFFDTTPSGRILSRVSTDQANMDVLLPLFTGGAIGTLISSVGALVVTCQVTWPILFLILPLMWVFVYYQNFYLASSREITRLDSISKAPIIFHFSETLAGIVSIRAFGKEQVFIRSNLQLVNTNIKMDFHNNGANEWLGFRLEMLGTLLLCTSALLLVTLPTGIIDSEKVGLALSYGLSLNGLLFWSIMLLCAWENRMVSVERVRQYTVMESEAPMAIEECKPPPNWPTAGTISIQNLQLRYRANTPLVLRGLSLRIRGGSKVGVVGRTGSGKSTLIQAFFRLVEPCGGHIIVDDVNILKLGLADLRSRFGIIPQEPILFEGTVRSNVDPLGQFSDERIWEVLRKCQLADALVQKNEGLDSPVTDNGENWSVGQKQLFCLARALLKESRVLFLDEATASVDAQTDAIIQKTIKEQFASSTVVSVAHRIPSVMDSDKVLVMAEGEVKEYERPMVLLERPSSLFGALVREYTARSGV